MDLLRLRSKKQRHYIIAIKCARPFILITEKCAIFVSQEFELDVLEEAYTTEHWLVRIYKVKDLENRGS